MIEPSMNQYAPPVADVADVTLADTAELKLFSAKGRIGRLRYLAYSTGASIVYNFAAGVLLVSTASSTTGMMLGTTAALIALLWFNIVTGIKRCHDIGFSGWWSLTLIIPIIALIWIFVPGDKGNNPYGPPPPPNTWGVRVLGVILPVIFFVGIIAAVAIPAYKGYTDKARAAQSAAPR